MKVQPLLLFIITLFLLNSCTKDDSNGVTIIVDQTSDLSPNSARLNSFFLQNINKAKQSFTIEASSPILITGNQGTEVQFGANSFEDSEGNILTGTIDIQLIEIYNKKDMLFLNKQTLGERNGTLSPLVSGGEFNITASQNGKEAFLRPGFGYNTTVPAPNGTDPNMSVFYQSSVSDDTLTWTEADTTSIWGNGSEYNAIFDSLGWINCDFFSNYPGNKTPVSVRMQKGLNNTNCQLFISFDGLNSLTQIWNFKDGNFYTGDYYTIPEGQPVHFIALAFMEDTPYSAIVPSTIVANHLEIMIDLAPTTQEQLAIDIQNLP